MCKSRGQCHVFQAAIVRRFGLGRRSVPDRLEEPSVVEPFDPFERRELHRLLASPRATWADEDPWLRRMLAEKPANLVPVALANKMARIISGLMVKGESYRAPKVIGAVAG